MLTAPLKSIRHIRTEIEHATLNAWRKGFGSSTSFAKDGHPSLFPSDAQSTSKTIMSKGWVSNGSFTNTKNPGFSTAQTCM